MGYTEVFGGTNIYPADVTYLALALTAPVDLDWPMESTAPPYPMARIIDVIGNGPHKIRLPDATQGSVGAITLFNLLTASSGPCFVTDHAGNTIATLGVGEQWEIYLVDNATSAGVWRVFRFGASTASVQPSALAGYGLTVTGSTLSQSVPVTTFNGTPRPAAASDRASAMVWTGAGSGTINLPGVATVGNNFFLSARNAGGGMLTLDPAGAELIDGGTTVALTPGEGVVLVTDGLVWYTLGRGQAAVFAFDYTVVAIPPGAATKTLTGAELNRIAYRFEGALTTNVVVVLPSTIQQYWVDNATTNAFTLSLNTATGVPVPVTQGSRGIYYCNGSSVIDADTSGIAVPINASQGGTGQVSYAVGDLLTASSPTTLARLAAAPVGNALIAKGSGTMPAWGQVDLASSVTGVLPPGRGGTGTTAFSAGSVVFAGPSGVYAQDNANLFFNDATNNLGVGNFAPAARVHASVPDGSLGFGVNGPTKGLRIVPSATGVSIEGVDQTLSASYQPIAITGTSVGITANGGAGNNIVLNGAAIANGTLTAAAGLFTTQTTVSTSTDNGGLVINYSGGLTGVTGPSIAFNEVDGSSALVQGGMVKSVCINSTAGTSTMDMAFWTRVNGVFAERMRLSSSGLTVNGQTVLTSGSTITGFLSSAMDVMVNDAGGYARFYFASGGTTYHVSPTGHNFRVGGPGGADPVTIDTSGNLSCTATITAAALRAPAHAIDATYYLQLNAGNPLLNFDANDYMTFNRAGNTLTTYIGGVQAFNVTAGSCQVGSGGAATLYMGDSNSYLYADGASATWLWEPGSYIQFNKSTDVLSFVIASGIYMDLRPSALTVNTALAVAGTGTFNGGSVYCQSAAGNPRSALYSDAGTGYLALFNGDGGRQGYVGAGVAAGAMIYANDRGGGHSFSGGDLVCANNVAAFSDAKLKTNLRVIPNALDGVCSLTGYTYERVDQTDKRRHTGLIAQDVQSVLPEAVGESDGTLTLSYGNMVGLLVEAIKELRAEVDSLKARL